MFQFSFLKIHNKKQNHYPFLILFKIYFNKYFFICTFQAPKYYILNLIIEF